MSNADMSISLNIRRTVYQALLCCCIITVAAEAKVIYEFTLKNGIGEIEHRGMVYSPDVTFGLTINANGWESNGWAYAPWFNLAHHKITILKQVLKDGNWLLHVEIEFSADQKIPGGTAWYELNFRMVDDRYRGTYKGSVFERSNSGELQVIKDNSPDLIQRPVAELIAGEHPRLISRADFKDELKRRITLPEGEAIYALLETAPVRDIRQVTDRQTSWIAANFGAHYYLTGDRASLLQAQRMLIDEVVRRPMPRDRADVQRTPRLMGLALAYDLCYAGFSPEIRDNMTHYLYEQTKDLFMGWDEGLPIEDWNPYPWSHRNAMRMGSVGLAALALLKEPVLSTEQNIELEHWIAWAIQDLKTYLIHGIGQSGSGSEGDFYKKLALGNGVLAFMHALQEIKGILLCEINPFLLAGSILSAYEGDAAGYGVSVRAVQASGLWIMGFSCVPKEYKPVMKWCFDRECGLLGNRNFDCIYPFQVLYALRNYPFGEDVQHPNSTLPWALPDLKSGYFVFRPVWESTEDILLKMDFCAGRRFGLASVDNRNAGDVFIRGFGKIWHASSLGFKPRNKSLGAEILYYREPRARQAVIAAQMNAIFMPEFQLARPKPERRESAIKPETAPLPAGLISAPELPGVFYPPAFKSTRYVGVDCSGVAGVPLLMALVDKNMDAGNENWTMGFRDARFSKDGIFSIDSEQGRLTGIVVTPEQGRGMRMRVGEAMFMIVMLSKGMPPQIEVTGHGIDATVRIGDQEIRFIGDAIKFSR